MKCPDCDCTEPCEFSECPIRVDGSNTYILFLIVLLAVIGLFGAWIDSV